MAITRADVLAHLASQPSSTDEIAAALCCPLRLARQHVAMLCGEGLVEWCADRTGANTGRLRATERGRAVLRGA